MMNWRRFVKVFGLMALAFSLSACGAPQINVGMSSTANLNLGANDKPLPVVVRVYQLSSKGPFESASFSGIWQHDMSVLGNSLLTKNEVVISPSSQHTVHIQRHAQAKYVGVAAIFRNPVESKWRAIYPLSNTMLGKRLSTDFSVNLVGSTVQISDN